MRNAFRNGVITENAIDTLFKVKSANWYQN